MFTPFICEMVKNRLGEVEDQCLERVLRLDLKHSRELVVRMWSSFMLRYKGSCRVEKLLFSLLSFSFVFIVIPSEG